MIGTQDAGALVRRAALSCIRLALLFVPFGVVGQQGAALGALAGVTPYDLGGVGPAPAVSFRLMSPLDRRVVVEGGVTHLSYSSQAKEATWHVLPKAQVLEQWVRSGIRPFLGVGIGARLPLPATEESDWRIPAALGLVLGAASTYAWLQSGGSTSLCDRSRNQDAMGRRECFALTVAGGAVGAGLGVLTARLLRSFGKGLLGEGGGSR